ncbi:hypothetical protein A0H81_10545 [Grifola frondosa]|uniref:Uncharacterized protein n=1 Tax=Grifola frondosa TaxID=5627 RepID=A0A1C7LYM1_GRIFR|nr:hypothetical protein A0H81_10545 [Grifola frondosa]
MVAFDILVFRLAQRQPDTLKDIRPMVVRMWMPNKPINENTTFIGAISSCSVQPRVNHLLFLKSTPLPLLPRTSSKYA